MILKLIYEIMEERLLHLLSIFNKFNEQLNNNGKIKSLEKLN